MTQSRTIDFSRVMPEHAEIDRRLENWARWVIVNPPNWTTGSAPMFKQYQSPPSVRRDRETVVPINPLDAWEVEQAISSMKDPYRTALRWAYVFKRGPRLVAASLGCSKVQLQVFLHAARGIVQIKLTCGPNKVKIAPESREYA